jgi:hypothetical protein
LLQELRAALLADFEPEIQQTCRVAVLGIAGYKRHEIRETLGMTIDEYRRAEARLKAAMSRLGTLRPEDL